METFIVTVQKKYHQGQLDWKQRITDLEIIRCLRIHPFQIQTEQDR